MVFIAFFMFYCVCASGGALLLLFMQAKAIMGKEMDFAGFVSGVEAEFLLMITTRPDDDG